MVLVEEDCARRWVCGVAGAKRECGVRRVVVTVDQRRGARTVEDLEAVDTRRTAALGVAGEAEIVGFATCTARGRRLEIVLEGIVDGRFRHFFLPGYPSADLSLSCLELGCSGIKTAPPNARML